MRKPFYESKTMWAGIILIVLALYEIATGNVNMEVVQTFAAGLGICGFRSAMRD